MENESMGFTPICISCSHKKGSKSEEQVGLQFEKKLKECSEAFVSGYKVPRFFKTFSTNVKQSALSQTHLCLLFEDGRVCRIAYRIDDSIDADTEPCATDNVDVPPSVKRSSRTNGAVRRNAGDVQQQSNAQTNSLRASLDQLAISTVMNMGNPPTPTGAPSDGSGNVTEPGNGAPSAQSGDPLIPPAAASENQSSIPYGISLSRIVRGSQRGRAGPAVVLISPNTGAPVTSNVIPAQDVPEELIEEAQAVLQGKSRSTIIRELQRTNLDINMAVNNLLGRDEAMNSGGDDEPYPQDFISLMSVPVVDETMEFHPTLYVDPNRSDALADAQVNIQQRRGNLGRRAEMIRDACGQGRHRSALLNLAHSMLDLEEFQRPQTVVEQPAQNKPSTCGYAYPLNFSSEIEWCKFAEDEEPGCFTMIAALHSELLLVQESDQCLVQWRYDRKLAYTDANKVIHHPRAKSLGLVDECVTELHARVCRAIVCTQSGKICSFMDETLGAFALDKLDSPAFQIANAHKPSAVFTSCYFSASMTENDHVFWWGAIPRNNRINVMNKARERSMGAPSQVNENAITVNAKVSMNALRFIQVGAVGYIVKDGIPKVGQLLDSVITTDSTYRFLVRNDIKTVDDILDPSELTLYEERQSKAPAGSKRKRSTSSSDVANDIDTAGSLATEFLRRNPNRNGAYIISDWYEENWHLIDVIFVEDSCSSPLGTVLMVDKNLVLVKLFSSDVLSNEDNPQIENASQQTEILSNTRIFRKDDLKPFDDHHSSFIPKFYIKKPKRLCVDFGKPLAMCLDNEALHCMSQNTGGIFYMLVDIVSSRVTKIHKFPYNLAIDSSRLLQSNCLSFHASLSGDIVLLRDSNQCPMQVKPAFSGAIQEIEWMRFMPFTSICDLVQPLKPGDPYSPSGYRVLTFATMSHSSLMPLIIRSEIERIISFIFPENMEESQENLRKLDAIVAERIDGDRNIIHAAIAQSFPISNRRSPPGVSSDVSSKTSSQRQEQKSCESASAWSSGQLDIGEFEERLMYKWHPVTYSLHEKETRGQMMVKYLLQTEQLAPRIDKLLTHTDVQGFTPFMYAVHGRSYATAIDVFEKILEISRNRDDKGEFLRKAVFPVLSGVANLDDSPLYMLCCNDTCSYTWTGDDHITQGSRCCCSECARVCHRNHDCRLKPASPTAYCDCWEDCKCRAMIAGDKKSRIILFNMLLKETDLVKHRNSRNEPVPLFVVQTSARQMLEQRQYKGNNRTLLRIRRSAPPPSGGRYPPVDPGQPAAATDRNPLASSLFTCTQMSRRGLHRNGNDKELSPPTFCHDVLDVLLNDYNAMLSIFCVDDCSITDRFILTLLTRLPESVINQLIVRLDGPFERFVQPFMESVARVVIYVSMITTNDARCGLPIGLLSNFHTRVPIEMRSKTKPLAPLLDKAREIFCMFPMKSIESIVEIAEMLLSPVKAGIVGADSKVHLYNDIKVAIQVIDDSLALCRGSQIFENIKKARRRRGPVTVYIPPHLDDQSARTERLLQRISDESDGEDDEDQMLMSLLHDSRDESNDRENSENQSDDSSIDDDIHDNIDEHDFDESYNFDAIEDDDCDEEGNESGDDEDDEDMVDSQIMANPRRRSRHNRFDNQLRVDDHTARDDGNTNEADMSGTDYEQDDNEDDEEEDDDEQTGASTDQHGEFPDDSEVSAVTPALRESLVGSTRECEEGDTDVDVEEVIAYSCESSDEDEDDVDDEDGLSATPLLETSNNPNTEQIRQANSGRNTPPDQANSRARGDLTIRPLGSPSAAGSHNGRGHRHEHRSEPPQRNTPIPIHPSAGQSATESLNTRSILCRGYAMSIRLISFVIGATGDSNAIEAFLEDRLAHTWSWMCLLMNANEISLLQAVKLIAEGEKKRQSATRSPLRSSYLSVLVEIAKRKEISEAESNTRSVRHPRVQPIMQFLKGVQSIWRSNPLSEHDSLPYVNLASCDYIAYVVDALLCLQVTLDKSTKPLPFYLTWRRKKIPDVQPRRSTGQRRDVFFERSESTTCIGVEPPDPFSTRVGEALPLVERPQILQPNTLKEEMWVGDQVMSVEDMMKEFICPNGNMSSLSWSLNLFVDSLESAKSTFFRMFNTEFKTMPIGDRSYLKKWRLTLDAFSSIFIDTIGQEQLSLYPLIAHFDYVESKFRHDAERLRQAATKEIRFENVERTRISLIYKLFRCLNVAYLKATTSSGVASGTFPLLTYGRVRVSFKDEPGEGVGVARSFYTSVINELLSDEPLPALESCQPLTMSSRTITDNSSGNLRERRLSISPFVARRSLTQNRDGSGLNEGSRTRRSMPCLPESAQECSTADNDRDEQQAEETQRACSDSAEEPQSELTPRVSRILSITPYQDDLRINETTILFSSQPSESKRAKGDDAPLFWKPQPDKEFYAPRPAFASAARINAFRNVGRLMGLCLLNNDILPISLCRHVCKYILNRDIAWHDLAFFDPTVYESMRHLLHEAEWNQASDISEMGLYWTLDLRDEEGGHTRELVTNGSEIPVNSANVQGYVKQYVQTRMIKIVEPFLKNMRLGILDVLPPSMLSNLTAEQFRLLLNGSDRIDVKTLYSYSTFIDESGEDRNEQLTRFKRWFWAVVEGMSAQKRQDLVLFWTGSPTLPSSVAGFQAAPSITIRHPDDEHLPTANTCISRLYIPLYSSKRILRQKLLYAIRAKNFGFI